MRHGSRILTRVVLLAMATMGLLAVAARGTDLRAPGDAAGATAASPTSGSAVDEAPRFPWPGGARADLTIPDSLWQLCRSRIGRTDRPLGFTADEMANFGRDALILRPVKILFRDARAIQRFSGKAAEDLIANAGDPAEVAQRAFGLTDVSAGRMLPMPDSTSWGVSWLPDATSPSAALDALLAYEHGGTAGRIDEADRRAWTMLPEPAQRLAVRIVIGACEAAPWIEAAYDDPAFAELSAGKTTADTAAVMGCYRFAMAPWVEVRMDQSATRSRASIEALTRLDREYLAFGSVIFLTHLQRALREYRSAETRSPGLAASVPRAFSGCRFTTALGLVAISGAQTDSIGDAAFLSMDLGGDDHYAGRLGVPVFPHRPIGVALDLDGNDTYEGGPDPVSIGCGLFGLGMVVDLAGDDQYRCAEAGLGTGCFGVGFLVDQAGDDTYVLDTHDGQGSALAGIGLLIDRAGDDSYTCGFNAQGFGETLGAGILVDVNGNDTYLARDDGNPSALYNGQSVSMAQGVGQGRRADLGDGHSLAGGIGFLVDGEGDDSYHATAWSQGAGYWWACGFLEDLGGNDRYRNGKYSLGAAAHFAIGCQVDLSGDDAYNVGNEAVVNQYQGHARDGSIGLSADGDGDDAYDFRDHCGGSADLNSIAVFWDRRGTDTYNVRYALSGPANGWTDTPPLGTATLYTPFRSFRDDLDAVGLFLDTGDKDRYPWEESATADSLRKVTALPLPGNDRSWLTRRGPVSWGLGWDLEAFPPERE